MIWLKWSWRDLRSRWVQVAAIAIVIAFGTGLFSGLRSMNVWRALSNDASYAVANTFDLRVSLGEGSFTERGAMLDALADLGIPAGSVAEERLILPTQVSIEAPDGSAILVPGRIIGVDVSGGGPHVNSLHAQTGRLLAASDAGQDVAMLEHNFAKFYTLPDQGPMTLSGGASIEYVGQALAPEYFFIVTPEGGILAQANFAAVFTSIETAQRLTGMDGARVGTAAGGGAGGLVNDLVIRLPDDARGGPAEDDLFDALGARFAEMGGSVTRRLDDRSIHLMIEDVEGDRQFNTVLAIAIFGGAVFAAFNLTSRVVDAQRREIGVAMALGVPTFKVALRPMLFSAQVALLGVVFGVLMGIGVAAALGSVLSEFLPLPAWRTPFQPDVFAVAAAAGFAAPFIATALPIWRGVRVNPIDAIRTGHLANREGGLSWTLARMRIPGGALWQIPFRNVARTPRRTLLTALAIGAVVAVMVTVMGMLDSFLDAIDGIGVETAGASPDRVEIALDTVYPRESPVVQSALDETGTTDAETLLRLGGLMSRGDEAFGAFIQFMDFDSPIWRPRIVDGSLDASAPGVVLAWKAAEDLDVGIGDTVALTYPAAGEGGFGLRSSDLPVVGIHAHPMRVGVYVDCSHCEALGVGGAVNYIQARPAAGESVDALKRRLFGLPGVASVQKATASSDLVKEQFRQYTGILNFILAIVLLLALLIAYNTANINMDERRREHATMFAYGLPPRAVMGMAMAESAALGLIATLVGLVAGYGLLQWVVSVLMPNAFPELGVRIVFDPLTLALVLVMGVAAVAIAPVLTVRRLRRMDVPSTLRVME